MGTQKSYAGCWGILTPGRSHEDYIHPDDLADYGNYPLDIRVFHCLNSQSGYLTMRYDRETFRIKPEIFDEIPTPHFNFGESIYVRRKNGDIEKTSVAHITWHYKKSVPIYSVWLWDSKKKRCVLKGYLETDERLQKHNDIENNVAYGSL